AKRDVACNRVSKPHCFPRVVQEDDDERQSKIEKIPVHVLQNQRKRALTSVMFARLTYCAGRRISPKRFVISPTVVVARQPESARRPQDDQRGRPRQPGRKPCGLRTKPTVRRITEQFG